MRRHHRVLWCRPLWASVLWALAAIPLAAQTIGGTWVDLGPGPAHNGQVEGIANREVVGAINALAPHPTDANILYVGAVNGGVWKTTNATQAAPAWTRLTDSQLSLSVASLELDPTDPTRNTIVAGIGRNSSLGGRGGAQIGLLRSTDGGASWSQIDGGVLTGRNVLGLAARGAILVAATSSGLYRSTNTGAAFSLLSGNGTSGLPAGANTDLAADPANNARLFVPVTSGTRGIYRSLDTGATWTKVSDAPVDAVLNAGVGTRRVEIVVGISSVVYLAIVGDNGRLADVFRSANGGDSWTSLGVPLTSEQGGVLFGAHPGGQGGTHLSLAADPTDGDIAYIGGDRQPYFGEGVAGSSQFFPNSLGANDYSGRLFRADAGEPPASRWTALTHSGTAGNSSPHADSRDMAFDANGNLLESDDGGVYRRTSPRSASGNWFSVNGNLQSTEYHDVSWDRIADRVIGGAQDTGTTEQVLLDSRTFNSVSTGDGGNTAVDDVGSATLSQRYSSFQDLQAFRRRTYNASNVFQGQSFPPLTPINGSPQLDPEFYSPVAANEVAGGRLIIGAVNGVYESMDQGATINRIATVRMNTIVGKPIVYGVPGNPDYLCFAVANAIWVRPGVGQPLASVGTAGAATLRDVAADPGNTARLFAASSNTVYLSTTSGASVSAINGNLASFNPGEFRSLAFVPDPGDRALLLGTDRGVYVAFASSGYSTWSRLGSGLPNAPVFTLDFDAGDNVLVAGVLGRGAWKLSPVLPPGNFLFRDGFESQP